MSAAVCGYASSLTACSESAAEQTPGEKQPTASESTADPIESETEEVVEITRSNYPDSLPKECT